MAAAVQIIPAVPQEATLNYDKHQFVKPLHMASVKSGLTMQDIDAMHHELRGRGQRWVPAFAKNDAQLRKVLAFGAFRYCHCSGGFFHEGLENDLPALRKMVEEKVVTYGEKQAMQHNAVNAFNGGYLQTRTRIAWLRWRCGYSCTDIAELMQLQPCNVRTILYRLCRVARSLGFETFKPHHSRRPEKPRISKVKKWTEAEIDTMAAMRAERKTWKQIAWFFGRRKAWGSVYATYHMHRGRDYTLRTNQWSEADIEKMEAMRAAGKKWKQIAWFFGRRKVGSGGLLRSSCWYRRQKKLRNTGQVEVRQSK